MNAVAPRARAEDHHRLARLAARCRCGPSDLDDTDRHRVDERIILIARLEEDLAADGRHSERVAVSADAAHHTFEQELRAIVVEPAEAERVERGDRARSHREDVAEDSS